MDIKELQDYRLSDAIKFHTHLNPRIWGRDEHLLPEVREKLLAIAADFKEFLGLDLEVKDITISGSNAAYTYTDHSDIDLHLVADLPKADASDIYRELFDAKKYQYNDQHNFKIGGYDVELYVQNANEDPKSQGIYSVLDNKWISVPKRRKPEVNDISVKSKYEDLGKRIEAAIQSGDAAQLETLGKKVREFRQAGLDKTGEFGPENLAFKILRSNGTLDQLRAARLAAKDQELSIEEARKKKSKKKTRYGFGGYYFPGYHYYGQTDAAADGGGDGGESVKENADSMDTQLQNFVKFCADRLELEQIPRIQIKRDPEWSRRNNSFGRYIPDSDTLIVSVANRHPMDVMRTMAHELTHRKQDEQADMPIGAGDTGSDWENQANAQAGVLMRDFAELHPEYFGKEPISEGKLTESVVFLNPNTVIVGQDHSKPLNLSPETLKRVQAIAAKHGAWYEGNGKDRTYTKGQIDKYVGSWDDEVAKTASPNDPKWLYVLFANVDENNRVQRIGVDAQDTIFNRLLATAKDNSFQNTGFTSQALQKFLSMASEGKYDFVKMSQQPATQENLSRFLKAGESLMWPGNWEQYPNKAGKIAKAATVDVRDQYLATRKSGVYVTGSGHIKAVQDITGQQVVAEDSFNDNFNQIDSIITKKYPKEIMNLLLGMFPTAKEAIVTQYNDEDGMPFSEWRRAIYDIGNYVLSGPVVVNGSKLPIDPETEADRLAKYQQYIKDKDSGKPARYFRNNDADPRTIDFTKLPPITLAQTDAGIAVTDGNHRAFLAKMANKPLRAYVWKRQTNNHPNVEKIKALFSNQRGVGEALVHRGYTQGTDPNDIWNVRDDNSRRLRHRRNEVVLAQAAPKIEQRAKVAYQPTTTDGSGQRYRPEAGSHYAYIQGRMTRGLPQGLETGRPLKFDGRKFMYADSGEIFAGADYVHFTSDRRVIAYNSAKPIPVAGPEVSVGVTEGMAESVQQVVAEASGYIPVNKKEAGDPRYSMALTVDIRPGENQRQAAKMGWKTNPAGTPPTAKTNGLVEALTRKLQAVKEGLGFPLVSEQEQELEEVAMSPSSLRAFAASPAAQDMKAGFEAELVFTGIGGDEEEGEWEPDYSYDPRAYSLENIEDFFASGEFAEGLSRQTKIALENDYMEWYDEALYDEFDAPVAVREWIQENDWDEEDLIERALDDEYSEDHVKEILAAMERRIKGTGTAADADLVREYAEAFPEVERQLDERVELAIAEQNSDYESALDEFRENWDRSESDWLRDRGWRSMSDIAYNFDATWPHMTMTGGSSEGGFNEEAAQQLADSLSEALGVETTVSTGYHGATRDTSTWIFEPDGSLDADDDANMPVEIVSPPMPLAKTLEILPKFFEWAEDNGAYANSSTGFHMSVSMPEHEGNMLDYTKLALFLGDEYVLKQFGREANTYARSAISKIRDKKGKVDAETVMSAMRKHLDQFASRALASPSGFGKYTSINPKNKYIEFRSAGGSNYFEDMDRIQNTLMRYARAMDIAMNPSADKPEYAKKLYKMLTDVKTQEITDPQTGTKRTEVVPGLDNDAIAVFSRFVAGELPKSELKGFIKKIQYGREVERQKASGKVSTDYDPDGNYVIRSKDSEGKPQGPVLHRFSATGTSAAIEQAKQWIEARGIEKSSVHLAHVENVPAEILATAPTAPPTQTPQTDQLNAPVADDPRGNYVLRRREGSAGTGPVVHRFSAPNNMAAVTAAREWTTAQGVERGTVWLDHISGVPPEVLNARPVQATLGEPRPAFTEPRPNSIPEVPLDIAQNFPPIQTEPQNFPAAQQTGGEFSGEWKVVDGLGREVHRFSGIGNAQSDANRVAREWAQRTGFDGNLEVYPVMR